MSNTTRTWFPDALNDIDSEAFKIPLLDINVTYIAGYERDAIMRIVRGG
ncbi:MAG: hypothetical protein QF570_07715 [Myxococcota bacterium]|nr:hypothetical protein [Myxococcota bacterium]